MPQERLVGNDYSVSLEICYDFMQAMATDEINHTLNYAEVYQLIRVEMQTPVRLIECLAGRIGQKLFDSFPQIQELTLRIMKLNPPMGADCDGAGVEVHLINDKTRS